VAKRRFPNWLSAYARFTRHSEAPDLFHFWTGVFTIAAVLRRQVWIDQRYFQWTPNFYIVLVAPAGIATKSTSLGLGSDLLKRIDGIHFGPDSMTWQGLTRSLEEAHTLVPLGTGIDAQYLPMSCVSCSVSELGTFLRPEDKTMTDVLTDLWDGKAKSWKRQTSGLEGRITIENPWINVMACTTPSWLKDNFTEAMVGGGLTSRIVFVYAQDKRKYVAYPASEFPYEVFQKEATELVEDLQIIAGLVGEYHLTKEALEWGKTWYEDHWRKRPEHMVSERFGGYIARKQTHIHKLAIVLAAAQRDELVIHKRDLEIANHMTTGLEVSMRTVFESIGVGDVSRMVNEILVYVRAYGEITQQALWRLMMPLMGPKEFEEASTAAIKAGYIKCAQRGSTIVYIAVRETAA